YENGLTGGYLASSIAGGIFKSNNDSLANLTVKANTAIAKAMADRGVNLSERCGLWSTSAAVVRLKKDTFEWIQIGDCMVLAINEDGSCDLLTRHLNHDRETLELWKDMAGSSQSPILTALKDQVEKIRACMNITYGVLNGEENALTFLQSGSRSLDGVKHILAFTDGFFIPSTDPGQGSNFNLLSTLFKKGGLHHVRDYVRRIETSDMTCRKYPRFKPHDDMAAISITF
ncbi:MAG: hypothetical protein D3926_04605, partial [Desulfobacteraceae bacterium]